MEHGKKEDGTRKVARVHRKRIVKRGGERRDFYQLHDEMLDLREKLAEAEENRLAGAKTYSIEEVRKRLTEVIASYES